MITRQRRGTVLRPSECMVGATRLWWVIDDLGPYDGPYGTCDEAWRRVEEIYAADEHEANEAAEADAMARLDDWN